MESRSKTPPSEAVVLPELALVALGLLAPALVVLEPLGLALVVLEPLGLVSVVLGLVGSQQELPRT